MCLNQLMNRNSKCITISSKYIKRCIHVCCSETSEYFTWKKKNALMKFKVSFKSHNFVQKVSESLWLSWWERLQNREVHRLQSFCQGADRKKRKTLQESLCIAVNLNRCEGEGTCMCSTADGGQCAAVGLTPAGGCPSACR